MGGMKGSDQASASSSLLPGGYINLVVRAGNTIRRPPGANASFVHEVLRFLEEREFPASPRFLGIDEQEREVLSYIEGHVAWAAEQPAGVWSDESLLEVALLVRSLHDLMSGSELARGAETILHGDLAPRNTVYVDLGGGFRPVAFIDWDLARPGRRADDVVDMLWHYLDPGPKRHASLLARRMRAMCDAYGLSVELRREAVQLMHRRMLEVSQGITAEAANGSAAHARLIEMGAQTSIEAQADWILANRQELEAGLA
jgi:hypothetical protein